MRLDSPVVLIVPDCSTIIKSLLYSYLVNLSRAQWGKSLLSGTLLTLNLPKPPLPYLRYETVPQHMTRTFCTIASRSAS